MPGGSKPRDLAVGGLSCRQAITVSAFEHEVRIAERGGCQRLQRERAQTGGVRLAGQVQPLIGIVREDDPPAAAGLPPGGAGLARRGASLACGSAGLRSRRHRPGLRQCRPAVAAAPAVRRGFSLSRPARVRWFTS